MKTEPIENIALPTGVKSLVQYRARVTGKFGRTKKLFPETVKGTPDHIKSAIIYNDLFIIEFNLLLVNKMISLIVKSKDYSGF